MIHQTLLRRAVAGRDPALVDFVDRLAPAILMRFASIPALGGSGKPTVLEDPGLPAGLPRFTAEALERFSEKHDQSMVTHILNGVFAGMRVAEKLPASKALSDVEKRLWLLGYVAHDYAKVYGIMVSAGDLPAIRQAIACLGDGLGFEAFLPHWKDYLDDTAFLAQNTQTVEGANLSLPGFAGARLQPRRLEVLRLLSSYADVLVHITSPADVAQRGVDGRDRATNLREKLLMLFGAEHAPRLAYHRLTEVRGLLSNLINNAVMEELSAQGYEPYLYFPNGVAYLTEPGVHGRVNAEALAAAVWERVAQAVGESEAFIKPWTTGFLVSSGLYELVGVEGVFAAGRQRAMRLSTNNAAARLYGFFTGRSENDLKKQFGGDMQQVTAEQQALVASRGIPADRRVHRLAEFLSMVFREARERLTGSPDVSAALLEVLGIQDKVTAEEAKRQKGGTGFGWFYCASRFIQMNPALDENGLDDLMRLVSDRVLAHLLEIGAVRKEGGILQGAIRQYVMSVVEVDGKAMATEGGPRPTFERELKRYLTAKARRTPVCSLCSGPFEATLQEATEFPFVNQQYSNKSPLAVKNEKAIIRGTCPICRIEMILRRVQQGGVSESDRAIQVYLYPTYFFTPETAQVVKFFLNGIEDLDVSPYSESSLVRHLRGEGYGIASLLQYDQLCVEPGAEPLSLRRMTVHGPRYSEKDPSGLFVFSVKPRKARTRKLTDTDAWALPALYGLLLPLVLNTKALVTPSFVPVFGTGADFRETTVLDAPHSFTRHALGRDRFRVDEVGGFLIRLLQLYDLHLDVFAEPDDLHWPQLNALAKDVATDPLWVFAYYERRLRKEKGSSGKKGGSHANGIPGWDVDRYLDIYRALGGEPNMGFIGEIVDGYAQFYRAEYAKLDSAHAVLRPLMTAINATLESDPDTGGDDLVLLVAGAINDDQERVRGGQADGFDPIIVNKDLGTYPERLAESRRTIEEFAAAFVAKVFVGYCHGDRAVLRERSNRIRSAARFYYLRHHVKTA